MTLFRLVFALLVLGLGAGATAQNSATVTAARQAGTVGERYDGYLGYSGDANTEVKRQVGAVNIKRRSLYTGLAARRNATVQEVGIAAGCELLAEVKPGEIYMLSDGEWHRRSAGEPAPAPGYCGR